MSLILSGYSIYESKKIDIRLDKIESRVLLLDNLARQCSVLPEAYRKFVPISEYQNQVDSCKNALYKLAK